jgi:hypothetical protein
MIILALSNKIGCSSKIVFFSSSRLQPEEPKAALKRYTMVMNGDLEQERRSEIQLRFSQKDCSMSIMELAPYQGILSSNLIRGVVFASVGLGWWMAGDLRAESPERVYLQKCASCHGSDGQGVSGVYESPLSGPRSIGELSRLIERTMPEGAPADCVAEEAAQVAAYIYHEFYSPVARIRKGLDSPASVELSRLTVSQYRNAVADVLHYFTPQVSATESASVPGLQASYYSSKGMSKADQLVQSRVDHSIDIEFGQKAPFEGMPDDQFAIVWEGALSVQETGEYGLRVSTPNGARVYLNLDPAEGLRKLRDDSAAAGQFPLIDAWVGSGEQREESARVFLLGGRQYPVRVEFFKYQESTASLRLEWKPPHGVWAVLDQQNLSTDKVGRTFVVQAQFPADDRSMGYERGTSANPEWYSAVSMGAVEVAEEVVQRLPLLSGLKPEDGEPASQASAFKDFVLKLAEVAYRRPLDSLQASRVQELPFEGTSSLEAAVRRAVAWVFCSPEFLYADRTPKGQPPTQHAVAGRLALTLWDSVPDRMLWEAAGAGELSTADQVQRQAGRMLQDPRARYKLRSFFKHWLHLEERDTSKDQELFPGFDEQTFADLRRSLDLFLDEVVWSQDSDYRRLLLSEEVWLNERLAELYPTAARQSGQSDTVEERNSSSFQAAILAGEGRAGVLTHPYLLSALAYHNNTSPIHRGVFVTRNVLGRALRPPPVAIAFENDEFPEDLTMRQKVTHLTSDDSCLSCHTIINPLGFSLEHFDAVGRRRETEGGKPIDSISDYETEDGEIVRLTSPKDIAKMAVESKAAHRAFVLQLFQHMTKQAPAAYGPNLLSDLVDGFEKDQFHIQNLMVRIAVQAALAGLEDVASPKTR